MALDFSAPYSHLSTVRRAIDAPRKGRGRVTIGVSLLDGPLTQAVISE
jgi:hypothetical protein